VDRAIRPRKGCLNFDLNDNADIVHFVDVNENHKNVEKLKD
jgi:hypothetical protein